MPIGLAARELEFVTLEQPTLWMATPEGKQKYARRRRAAESPFAHIQHHFGVRRFLLRGLERVRQEWRWLTSAFNLSRLLNLMPRGLAGRKHELAQSCAGP